MQKAEILKVKTGLKEGTKFIKIFICKKNAGTFLISTL